MRRAVITFSLVIAALDLSLHSTTFFTFFGTKEDVVEEYVLTGTMYNATTSQCDSDPLVTAGMLKIIPHKASTQKFVALSRDMLKRWGGPFDYGDSIVVTNAGEKDGVYIVADAMNKRYKHRLDFLETKGTKHYKLDSIRIHEK